MIVDALYFLVAGPGFYHAVTGSIARRLRASLAGLTLHAWIGCVGHLGGTAIFMDQEFLKEGNNAPRDCTLRNCHLASISGTCRSP